MKPRLKSQTGLIYGRLLLGLAAIVAVAAIFLSGTGHAVPASALIRSGISGYCLDSAGQTVITSPCANKISQAWQVNYDSITQAKNCLSVINDSKNVGAEIGVLACQNRPGQVWLRYNDSFYNPNAQLCLSLPLGQVSQPVELAACSNLNPKGEQWLTDGANSTINCPADKGQQIACQAVKQWVNWHSAGASHLNLLTSYTDGAPYEEWCADFVSYVYKAAGYPFSGGETDGWDENNANNIINMGFSQHDPSSYTPQPGDVAYFDYQGGHVEIVISGGKIPTFIYGNSAKVDPTTGNGQMAANTITSDGDNGSLVYYLTAN